MNWKHMTTFVVATILSCASVSFAQTAAPAVDQSSLVAAVAAGDTNEEKKDSASPSTAPAPQPQAAPEGKIGRWFELQNFTISTRYRNVTDSVDGQFLSQNQHREIIDMKFKFDAKGKYSLNAHVSSGYYFNWAYADSGWGKGTAHSFPILAHDMAPFKAREIIPGVVNATVNQILAAQYAGAPPEVLAQVRAILTPQVTAQVTPIVTKQVETAIYNQIKDLNNQGWNLYFRQFYFSAKPIEGVEVQYGGIGFNRGVSTEMTSYDDDGYLVGGRISIKRPKQLFFNEVSITYAYLGDEFKPNFFRRTERLGHANYHQFLVRKQIGTRAEASADYTWQDRVDMMREAIKVNIKETKVLDWVRFETYQRIGDNRFVGYSDVYKAGNGFAFQAEKTIKRKLSVGGGYSQIDRNYTALNPGGKPFGYAINGDRTGVGDRFFAYAKYQFAPEVSFDAYFSKPVHMNHDEFTWNKRYFTAGFIFDAKKLIQKTGLLN